MLCSLRAPPQSQVDPGVEAGPIVGVPVSGTSGQWSGTGTHNIPHLSLENVIQSPVWTPRRQNPVGLPGVHSGASPPALLGGQTCLPIRGKSQWVLLVTLTSGSTLGIGNGALPLEVGTMESLLATSNISRLTRLPLSSTEARYLWSSYTALQSIPMGILEWTAHL